MFKLGLCQAVVRRSIRLKILSQIFAERKFGPHRETFWATALSGSASVNNSMSFDGYAARLTLEYAFAIKSASVLHI